MPDDVARRLRDEGLDPTAWFALPVTGDAHDLDAGDRLELPAGTSHAALVGPAGVTCLEAHLPAGSLAGVRRCATGSW